jgi:hypothetical protein
MKFVNYYILSADRMIMLIGGLSVVRCPLLKNPQF